MVVMAVNGNRWGGRGPVDAVVGVPWHQSMHTLQALHRPLSESDPTLPGALPISFLVGGKATCLAYLVCGTGILHRHSTGTCRVVVGSSYQLAYAVHRSSCSRPTVAGQERGRGICPFPGEGGMNGWYWCMPCSYRCIGLTTSQQAIEQI